MGYYKFSVIIEKGGSGYHAACPAFHGCYAEGRSYEEALANIKTAIRLYIEDSLGDNEEIPQVEPVGFTLLDVAM